MNREHKNPQFEFLKQNHPWNPFFLILVESYARCLLPPKNYVTKLKEQYSDKQNLLEDIIKKFENDKQQKLKKQLEEQKELEQRKFLFNIIIIIKTAKKKKLISKKKSRI